MAPSVLRLPLHRLQHVTTTSLSSARPTSGGGPAIVCGPVARRTLTFSPGSCARPGQRIWANRAAAGVSLFRSPSGVRPGGSKVWSLNGNNCTTPLPQRHVYSSEQKPASPVRPADGGDRSQANDETPSNNRPIARRLEVARERTQAVREKVRSSLTSLTPHENIYNLPNFLTVTRLFAAPATAYLLLHNQHGWALVLFAYAGITDLVDGYLARKWNLQTVAGSVIDPMADKALMIIVTVTLAVKGALPLYLATLILGRDASLAVAAIYYRYASLPAPKTFMRYWDFSLPSAEVHPTTVSKYNTFLQLVLIGSTLALPVVTATPSVAEALPAWGISTAHLHTAMMYFQCLVAGTTAWSGMSYAFLKDAVTILGKDDALKAKQGARGRAIIGVTFGSVVLASTYFALTGWENDEKAEDDEK